MTRYVYLKSGRRVIDRAYYADMVSGPGKFEGEAPATAYFYAQMLNGDGEDVQADDALSDDYATSFVIDADESEAFGIGIGNVYMIREDPQGFVIGSEHATREDAEETFSDWLGL